MGRLLDSGAGPGGRARDGERLSVPDLAAGARGSLIRGGQKGRQVAVSGRVDYSESEQDGQKRYWTDIIADDVEFLGAKEDRPKQSASQNSQTETEQDDEDLPF